MLSPWIWRAPPAELALGPRDVHVWRVALDQPARAFAGVLSDDERARAARFHFDRDRDAYTIARGALRTLAGRYLGRPPAALGFGYRAAGKPYLRAPDALRFNVSHSGAVALIGFARDLELGVDLERRHAVSELAALAQASFSPDEYARFSALPAHDREPAFFRCWSRKEAVIKATGEGIAQLAEFDVSLDTPARLLRIAGDSPARWTLDDLPELPGYAAALAVAARDLTVSCWQLAPLANTGT